MAPTPDLQQKLEKLQRRLDKLQRKMDRFAVPRPTSLRAPVIDVQIDINEM